MAELRSVDPRTLKPNPNNPRRTPVPPAMDEQLVASIKAIGIIQPPVVREADGKLIVKAGGRRVKAAIAAELPMIDVLVKNDDDDATVPMVSLSENLIRASMTSVDIWRGVEDLEKRGWNEQAIADALNLPVRTIKRLKLLAHIHPPMLDVMAQGSMPSEEQLRTIAAASLEEQTQVWKKNKPKKGHEVYWHEIARALSKRRIPFSAARFDDDLARAYGVVWEDDLFVPAGEDGRYTTNVEAFFGAQQEWLANNLPERGSLLAQDEYGRPVLPKKAEQVYSKPGKTDVIGHYLDPHTGEVKTIAYRVQADKSTAKPGKSRGATASETPQPKSRPDVTQKGNAIIGDLRTAARPPLHRRSSAVYVFCAPNFASVRSGPGATVTAVGHPAKLASEGSRSSADDQVRALCAFLGDRARGASSPEAEAADADTSDQFAPIMAVQTSDTVSPQQFSMRLSLGCSVVASPKSHSWHETCVGVEIGDSQRPRNAIPGGHAPAQFAARLIAIMPGRVSGQASGDQHVLRHGRDWHGGFLGVFHAEPVVSGPSAAVRSGSWAFQLHQPVRPLEGPERQSHS